LASVDWYPLGMEAGLSMYWLGSAVPTSLPLVLARARRVVWASAFPMASRQAQHQIQMESWRLARDRIIIRVGVMFVLYTKSSGAVFSFFAKNCSFFVAQGV